MVANCCICKSHLGQDENVSFHKIPRNQKLADEWIKIINRIGINITRTATVCSNHFDDHQFLHKKFGGTIRRFLTPTAVPTKVLSAPLDPSDWDEETEKKAKDDTEDVTAPESDFLIDIVKHEIENENSTLSERTVVSADKINGKRAPVKTIRYIGDLGREDFTSDEARDVVKCYVGERKDEIESLKQEVQHLRTKLMAIRALTEDLVSDKMLTSNNK